MVDPASSAATAEPARRIVVLGASNVTRNISTVVAFAGQAWGLPADYLIAAGHGRSLGKTSRVLTRRLPGILDCGIWDALKNRVPLPTAALLTDVGNDLVFGMSVREIMVWVRECLERLAPHCQRITMTELPLESVAQFDEFRFVIMRSLLFPKSKLQLSEAIERSRELNGFLREIAAEYGAAWVENERVWYGLDPIHYRSRYTSAVWQKVFATWREDAGAFTVRDTWRRWLYLITRRPMERDYFHVTQRAEQPVARLEDGSLLSLY
jgi:hypothetical protein